MPIKQRVRRIAAYAARPVNAIITAVDERVHRRNRSEIAQLRARLLSAHHEINRLNAYIDSRMATADAGIAPCAWLVVTRRDNADTGFDSVYVSEDCARAAIDTWMHTRGGTWRHTRFGHSEYWEGSPRGQVELLPLGPTQIAAAWRQCVHIALTRHGIYPPSGFSLSAAMDLVNRVVPPTSDGYDMR